MNDFVRIATTLGGFTVYRRPEDRSTGGPMTHVSRSGVEQKVIAADFSAEDAKFRAAISSERKAAIAQQLCVNVAALDSIGIGRADNSDLKRLRAGGAGWKASYPTVVTSFPERDATGTVVGFCFRADDGRKGSPSGKVGAKRGLIVPSTLRAGKDPIFLVEGPSDVAACETLGLASVGRPSNAAGGMQIAQLLLGREVLIVGENDQNAAGSWPGRDGAEKLARQLASIWSQDVHWALPPDGFKDIRAYLHSLVENGLDVDDQAACHEAGNRLTEGLMAAVIDEQSSAPSPEECKDDRGAREIVLHLCTAAGDLFFHDNERRAFVLVREGGVERTLLVRSREYGLLLVQRYYRGARSGLPSAAKTEALATLESVALFEGEEEAVFVRIGEYEDKVVLDLCDDCWRVVVIDRSGWKVVEQSSVRFRRSRGMLALPIPVPGGSIQDLRPFINVPTDSDFVLVCAFILGCFNPRGPFVILLVNGEQGSAKSTLCRLVRSLIDPNKSPLRSEPKDNRDLAVAANNAWMIGLDNMSRISERLSNAICRLATGGGFATRELYSDSDETIFDAKRPVIINGIGDVADRSDLIDRAIRLTLPTIPEHQRRTENAVWSEFEQKRPAILGAFLDAVSAALRNQSTVRFAKLPRMADSASWVVAAEPACPWAPGSFIDALDDRRRDADEFVIEASPLANAVRDWVEKNGGIEGTATEILELLSANKDPQVLKHPNWPKRAPALGTKLREVAPNLRRLGIEVTFSRSGRHRTIAIRKNKESPDVPSSLSLPSLGDNQADIDGESQGSVGPSGDSALPLDDSESASGDGSEIGQKGLKLGL